MLQKEIQNTINKPNYPQCHYTDPGDLCLARVPDDSEYNRALILKVENGNALCFFVDFGDEVVVPISDLKHIGDKFITKLPFQSIQCSLHGIKAVLNEWQEDATNILYKYSVEPQTDIFRSLFVKVCGKATSIIMNQNKYFVVLKDGFGEKNVLINQLLIDCGVASSNSGPISDFEIPVKEDEIDDDELIEETERILDICRKTEDIDENFHQTGIELV